MLNREQKDKLKLIVEAIDDKLTKEGYIFTARHFDVVMDAMEQVLQQTPCTTLLPLTEILPIAEKRLKGMRQHSKDGNPEYHYLKTDLYEDVEDVIKLIYAGQ